MRAPKCLSQSRRRFTVAGRQLSDTDWYVDQLYGFAADMGASVIKANYSRYVVDLNRSPDSSSLYATNPTSPVCAAFTFGGDEIYRTGEQPQQAEIAERIEHYWQPYHDCIHEEIERARERMGLHCCGTRTPSRAKSPGCSLAFCRSSTSARATTRRARPSVSSALLRSVLPTENIRQC